MLTRNLMVVAVMLALSMGAQSIAHTKDQVATCTLKISGMTCGGCEGAVKIAAKRVEGVKTVTASAKTGTAEVTYDAAKTSPDAIARAVTVSSGFKAVVLKR